MNYQFKNLFMLSLFVLGFIGCSQKKYDIVIYGGSPAGITAAIQAKELGKSVILIAPEGRIGGLTTSGLGATDIGKKGSIGGLASTFYKNIKEYYFNNPSVWKQETLQDYQGHVNETGIDKEAMWYFEPHVAEKIFKNMLGEAGVEFITSERLDLRDKIGVQMNGTEIHSIRMESGKVFIGKVFIDATYEGDLMAKSGVTYTVGREANDKYGETVNGIQNYSEYYNPHLFARKVDPYIIPGNKESGLIYGVQYHVPPGLEGEGDNRVQAYCFRLCMTDVRENQVPFPKPVDYDATRYELLLRYMLAGEKFSWVPQDKADTIENMAIGWNPNIVMMPNRKTDSNTKGPISFNLVGGNYEYPNGDYTKRRQIVDMHKSWQQGLLWFMANDSRVPSEFQEPVKKWGLAKDEFTENNNWPPQLYIREARRMNAEYVMTQNDCEGRNVAPYSIGLASYTMDSHIVSRYVYSDGYVKNEGHIGKSVDKPFPISYLAIVPKKNECSNLLVPVCLSASHAAYGSIRMEPVFMILGQSAATAASLAIDGGSSVQAVPYRKLERVLIKDGQRIK